MNTNYKGKLARLIWDSGNQEMYGAVLEHTEVFVFECRWGEWYRLDPSTPPQDLTLEIRDGDTLAVFPTDLLGRRGALLLLAAPVRIELRRLDELSWRLCDLPCKISTTNMTPIVCDGRCVRLSPAGLLQFGAESLEAKTPVTAEIALTRTEHLILPGQIEYSASVGPINYKLLVRFGELDRLTTGRLRSLASSLT